MAVPVNLYVDRMSPVQPVRVADVYAVTQDRASAYSEAAAKMGLTKHEYAEFRQALTDGGALYVQLPRHIDAMAGVHARNGHVYVLRNVIVPSATMGWRVNLADGTSVLIPRVCGNLSMIRGTSIARRPPPVPLQPTPIMAATYVAPPPVAVASTPVTFDAPPIVLPPAAPAAVDHQSPLPFLVLLAPVVAAWGNHSPGTPAEAPLLPPCSEGSNSLGACRQ